MLFRIMTLYYIAQYNAIQKNDIRITGLSKMPFRKLTLRIMKFGKMTLSIKMLVIKGKIRCS